MEQSVNIFNPKGLNLDSSPLNIDEGEYTYALNANVFKEGDSYYINNYEGNKECVDMPAGYMIIGACMLADGSNVLFLTNSNDTDADGLVNSEIGILSGCTYTQIVRAYCLDFRIEHQIQSVAKENAKCGRVIYWTDDYNPRRYMNLDNLPLLQTGTEEDGCTPIYEGLDCDFIRVDKKFEYPCMDINISTSGALKSGSYFIFFQYSDINGTGLTNWGDSTNRIDIISRDNSYLSAGDIANTATNKSIDLTLTGLDNSFTHYNLGVIKSINGILTAQFIITLPVTIENYTYSGNESTLEDLDVNSIIVKSTIYEKFKTVASAQGYLLWGNIQGKQEYNYQPYANDIQVQWVNYRIKATDYYNKNHPYYNLMSLMKDEVYPAGIRLIRNTGERTCTYHIPARALNTKSDGTSFAGTTDQYGQAVVAATWDSQIGYSSDDVIGDEDNTTPRWKIYNTATVEGFTDDYNDYITAGGDASTYEGCYKYGETSYWESTLTYENNTDIWGDLACQPIRHHKMPDCSIDHIHENLNGSATISEYPYLHILGIQCDNIQIDSTLFPDIVGYEIVIGDRTYQKSIVAKGLLFNNMEQEAPGGAADAVVPAPYIYTNWMYNDLSSFANFGQTDDALLNSFSFYSPDTTFKNTSIGSTSELKLEAEEFGTARYSGYDYSVPVSDVNTGTNTENNINFLGDIVFSTGWYNNYVLPQFTSVRREIDNKEYILNNSYQSTTLGNVNNLYRESTVMLDTSNVFLANTKPDDSKSDYIIPGVVDGDISSYYGALKNNIPNLWGNIENVTYIAPFNMCSIGRDEVSTGCLFGGDTFISFFSFHKRTLYPQYVSNIGIANTDDILNDDGEWGGDGTGGNDPFRLLYGNPVFYCESFVNVQYRYSGTTIKETFYPNLQDQAVQLYQFESPTNMWPDVDNYYNYNFDYSRSRNINSICTQSAGFNPEDCVDNLFTKIIYSERANDEGLADNWLTYLPQNYAEFPKEDGELVDIRPSSGDRVLFRLANTIYLKEINQEIQVNTNTLSIGNGSLFGNPEPSKLFSVDGGYIGTNSQWAFTSTPYGSFMIDSVRKKIFQFKENFQPISNKKMISWFNKNTELELLKEYPEFENYDNPANPAGIGYISTFDPDNNLVFITKRDYKPRTDVTKPTYSNGTFTLDEETVELTDTEVFDNKSWTLAFNPLTEFWISWYSFIPNGYITEPGYFKSYTNGEGSTVWERDLESTNTYFGEDYPHIIEGVIKNKQSLVTKINQFIVKSNVYKLDNGYEEPKITFNKAVVYNNEQNTGNLVLVYKDPLIPSTSINYPISNSTSTSILVSRQDSLWSFHSIFDKNDDRQSGDSNFATDFTNTDFIASYPIDKVIDNSTIDYNKNWYELAPIKGTWAKLRLQFDRTDRKIVTDLVFTTKRKSVRS